MKLFAVIFLSLVTTASFAQNSYFADNRPTDLILFPDENEVFAAVNLYADSVEYDWTDFGRVYSENEIKDKGLEFGFMYGLNQKWAFAIEAEYSIKSESKTKYGPESIYDGVQEETQSKGFNDPMFAIIYRVLDREFNSFDMNLTFNFSPSVIDAEHATTTKDGNNAKGHSTVGVQFEWGRRMSVFSWATLFSLQALGEAESKDASNGSLVTRSAFNIVTIGGLFKWNIGPSFSLDVKPSIGISGDYEMENASGSKLYYDGVASFSFEVGANIEVQDDLFLVFDLLAARSSFRDVRDSNGSVLDEDNRTYASIKAGLVTQF